MRMHSSGQGFRRLLVLGELDDRLPARAGLDMPVRRLAGGGGPGGAEGWVAVDRLLRAARRACPEGRLLVLTSLDLRVPECESLLGFADRRLGIAVVSTARIADPDPDRVARRVRSIAAHEAGHLDGLMHCETDRCLMGAAADTRDVDDRSMRSCGECPRIGGARRRLLAAAMLVLVVAASVSALSAFGHAVLGPDLEVPFTCRAVDPLGVQGGGGDGPDDVARFHFQGRPMFTMYDKDGRGSILERSRPVMHELNDLWRSDEPLVLAVGEGGSVVEANGAELMSILPADLRGRRAHDVASEWIEQIVAVFRAGGKNVSVAGRSPAHRPPRAEGSDLEVPPHG